MPAQKFDFDVTFADLNWIPIEISTPYFQRYGVSVKLAVEGM